jgi:cytochrome c oxidase subunit IV
MCDMADEQEKAGDEVKKEVAEAPEEAAAEIRQEAKVLEHTPPVEAFEAAKESIVEAIESIPPAPDSPLEAQAHLPSQQTVILGMTLPYSIYTVVFGILAVLTLLEVLVGTASDGFLRIPILLAVAVVKAALVVLYYMHLKSDTGIYRWTLIIPLIIGAAATIYLLLVPPNTYGS